MAERELPENIYAVHSASPEISVPVSDVLQPGVVIKIPDITYFSEFEDVIAAAINPTYDKDLWAGRVPLKELIRPPKFNGRITDISVTVMDRAYAQLQEACESGRIGYMPQLHRRIVNRGEVESYESGFRGFILTADAKSAGRGTIGQIQTAMWYWPLTVRSINGHGQVLNRKVAKPKIEKERFIALDARSRKIGFSVERKAVARPIFTPMQS